MVGGPERIGRYRVEEVIGAGGFATVYRASDDRLAATVAVKVLAENHSLDPDVRERFLTEGRILRRIDSRHVVAIHDLGETERGQPYLVLDYADRGTLEARVRNRRAGGWTPDVDDAAYLAGVLAESLRAVHASHVVHRDLAPRNLLLRSALVPEVGRPCKLFDADERLLLADLGLSKDLAAASGLTVAGGTAGFTPPEQRRGPAQVDERADIWAASAVLVWLLLDHPPDEAGEWRRELAYDRRWSVLEEPLARGLEHEPADRFPSVTAWHGAVDEALTPRISAPAPRPGVDAGAGVGAPPPVPGSGKNRRSRRRGRWLVLLLLLLASSLAGLALARSLSDDDRTGQTVEQLEDGQVRVRAEAGDLRVALSGPREMTVGETATFDAEVSGAQHWIWFGPDGRVHPDADQIQVTATSPGSATVRLRGVDDQNQVVEAVHHLRVVEE